MNLWILIWKFLDTLFHEANFENSVKKPTIKEKKKHYTTRVKSIDIKKNTYQLHHLFNPRKSISEPRTSSATKSFFTFWSRFFSKIEFPFC